MSEKISYWESVVPAREFEQYPLPWGDIFHRKTPFAVEIGFGNGDFLIEWARRQPQWNFIGIELSMESLVKLQKRLHQKKITNIRSIRDDARFALREFFPENFLRYVIMNFPDPWPKDRHKSHRLLDEDFTRILAAVLEERGVYELVTDQQWYAEHAAALFQASPYFEAAPTEENPPRPATTKYEQKWRGLGRSSYRVLAWKVQTATINRLLEDVSMPHVFVEKEIKTEQIKKLTGLEHIEGDTLFIIKATFADFDNQRFLIRTVAKDGSHTQGFYIVVNRHEEKRWLVKLDPILQPYRTPAVKMAVRKIGEILNSTGLAG